MSKFNNSESIKECHIYVMALYITLYIHRIFPLLPLNVTSLTRLHSQWAITYVKGKLGNEQTFSRVISTIARAALILPRDSKFSYVSNGTLRPARGQRWPLCVLGCVCGMCLGVCVWHGLFGIAGTPCSPTLSNDPCCSVSAVPHKPLCKGEGEGVPFMRYEFTT